jgi:hypothetical protein
MADGNIVLSSYVAPLPNQTLSCEPEPISYVAVGYYPTGKYFRYDTTDNVKCNFTTG